MGFTYQMMQFQEERLWARRHAVQARRAHRETIDYTRERQAFGQPVLDNQVVHFRLAELQDGGRGAARADLPRVRAVHRRQGRHRAGLDGQAQGRPPRARGDGRLPAVLGRHGLHLDNPSSRSTATAGCGSIGGGADEVMLGIICKHMGILPGKRNR